MSPIEVDFEAVVRIEPDIEKITRGGRPIDIARNVRKQQAKLPCGQGLPLAGEVGGQKDQLRADDPLGPIRLRPAAARERQRAQ